MEIITVAEIGRKPSNVIVSGVLKAGSRPGRILDLLLEGSFEAVVSEKLLDEYRDVLAHPEFRFDRKLVEALVAGIRAQCQVTVASPQNDVLSADPDDQMIIDLAVAARATIVTGNSKHFDAYDRTITPDQMLEELAR